MSSTFVVGLAYPMGAFSRGRNRFIEEMKVAHDLVESLEEKTDLWNCIEVRDLNRYLETNDTREDKMFFSLVNRFIVDCDLLLVVMGPENRLLGLVERAKIKGKETILCIPDQLVRLVRCADLLIDPSENLSADVFPYATRGSGQYPQLFPLVEKRLREFLTREESLLFPISQFPSAVRIPIG